MTATIDALRLRDSLLKLLDEMNNDLDEPPPLTPKIDAVARLIENVLPGWRWSVGSAGEAQWYEGEVWPPDYDSRNPICGVDGSQTPALALFGALLAALVASEQQTVGKPKLTKLQIDTLRAVMAEIDVTSFGLRIMGALPAGVTLKRLDSLQQRGLIKSRYIDAFRRRYTLTAAGRDVLAELSEREGDAP